ncbi:DNA-binding protein [Streptomyces eurocidicus]|uniref:DNA-binding protein n=1 Tax=Streptomyces eurocidicus TaxID=66423 RepID=A0A2N8NNK6_STREU|nr:helix-turn-helix transcriptional regulator [Streptomyces eurocidicus]MBB5116622.1 transcriptional regulator with XRE-family HTH domain [Streptomyces eurocidicus]MBF6052376.1 helix-turn-helix domain-containing protein [Streptomyces eurocidicus]PNE30352.1 DNA-binding protein [Streptomyces eurocidicus]
MPPRSNPTIRQRRLGAALRQLREQAGMSASDAAALLGVDRTRISNTEAGRFGISAARVRTLACNYRCPDAGLVQALADMAQDHTKGWWEQYRGALPAHFLDIAELEWHALRLRNALTSHVPGLLQTADHARALFEMVIPQLPEEETRLRVAQRLERRQVLDRDDPPAYDAIIHESALHMQFGGRDVARAQLKHLLESGERDHVSLRVIPFTAGGFPGAGQTILYAHGPVTELDTVQLDASHGSVFIDSGMQLANYRELLSKMELSALSEEDSRQLIHAIAQQL